MLLPDRYSCPPWPFSQPDFQTLYGSFVRRVPAMPYARERLELEDGDFLDLDLVDLDRERIAIICHGLEGSSRAPYVLGVGSALHQRGWGIAAMNFRGCSGEPNRLLRSYHSGATEDLDVVVDEVCRRRPDALIALVGFSLGGNLVLKYAGERSDNVRSEISGVVAISTPCDLSSSAARLAEWRNGIYMRRFLYHMKGKLVRRQAKFPGAIDYEAAAASKDFAGFDGSYTAPVHGFESAEDYWAKASAKTYAANIRVPTLLLNSRDDSFLTEPCHLTDIADGHQWFNAEITRYGGHVAYSKPGRSEVYQDLRTAEFLERL